MGALTSKQKRKETPAGVGLNKTGIEAGVSPVIKISSLKSNPRNPRFIKDARFKKLVESLRKFPQMMELSPIVVDETNMLYRGHMRVEALRELGYKEIPETWVKMATDFTTAQLQEFMIKDNDHAGQWDWEALANEWEQSQLLEWGFEPWNFGQIELSQPDTVEQNLEELEKIREQRKKGNEGIVAKTDTEKYLVIVFATREEKIALLKELGLPEDERYVPAGGIQIIPSGAWMSKFKAAAQKKAGATG